MFELYSLVSGSSGNSSLVTNGKTHILIDCGTSGKRAAELIMQTGIDPRNISAVLLTHEHTDHTKGAGIISRRFKLPVYGTRGTLQAMDVGKLDDDMMTAVETGSSFEIGDIGVIPFDIPHDAAAPCGYSFVYGNTKLTVATDMGHITDEVMNSIKGSESVILESNHDTDMLRFGEYPYPLKQRIMGDLGHLSNTAAADAALRLAGTGTKHIMLGHLSDKNNMPEIAKMEVFTKLTDNGVDVGGDVTLQVARRYELTMFESGIRRV